MDGEDLPTRGGRRPHRPRLAAHREMQVSMRQSLEIKLGQRLTMTPQLQQAIRLLQLSTLELRQEIQQALESNMMLEVNEDGAELEEAPESLLPSQDTDDGADPGDVVLNDPWSQDEHTPPVNGSGNAGSEGWDFNQTADTSSDPLRDHLQWQLDLSHFSETDRLLAQALIDAIDEDGYLCEPLESIGASLPDGFQVEIDEIEAVLRRVQHFDPLGVAARDLRETLLIQLEALALETPARNSALALVRDHLDMLAGRDFSGLMRRLGLTEPQLQATINLIQSMNPRPGGQISTRQAGYIVPDVYVRRARDGSWRVELNNEANPRLRINHLYEGLVRRSDNGRDAETMKQHLQEARWFIKSLQSRNETLLKVATSIVERQKEFFQHGEIAMQPLVLREIAEAVEMHESTVSRVTNQKYMHTPRGIFEFKYFFSSGVSTSSGGEASSIAIHAMIRQLIAQEDVRKPLSDSKLAAKLRDNGINVARRTIAKYREALSIPPSNERRRLS